MFQVHLSAVISPTSKFHETALLVVRKVLNVHLARTFVNRWWLPENFAGVFERGFCHQRYFVVSILLKVYDHYYCTFLSFKFPSKASLPSY